jgi:hypothetical protein
MRTMQICQIIFLRELPGNPCDGTRVDSRAGKRPASEKTRFGPMSPTGGVVRTDRRRVLLLRHWKDQTKTTPAVGACNADQSRIG